MDSKDLQMLIFKNRKIKEKNWEMMSGKNGFKMFMNKWLKLLFYQMVYIGKAHITGPHKTCIPYIAYKRIHMKNWLKAGFRRDQMLILNGEELIANPAKVILKAQDFMGLEPLIKEQNFVFDNEKGILRFSTVRYIYEWRPCETL